MTSTVTILSILGAQSVAVPLSPGFPAHELKYILDHSQASVLLSSQRYHDKVQEIFRLGLEGRPKFLSLENKNEAGEAPKIQFAEPVNDQGGMMLYTSGTTSRPVSTSSGITRK